MCEKNQFAEIFLKLQNKQSTSETKKALKAKLSSVERSAGKLIFEISKV